MLKKLNLNLEGKDGNAFFLLGYFQKEARRAGWTKDEIALTMKDAQSGDYNHLIQVLMDC